MILQRRRKRFDVSCWKCFDFSAVYSYKWSGLAIEGPLPSGTTRLTPLEPQSHVGDNPVKFQVVCPQNGTAVLKGLRVVVNGMTWGVTQHVGAASIKSAARKPLTANDSPAYVTSSHTHVLLYVYTAACRQIRLYNSSSITSIPQWAAAD